MVVPTAAPPDPIHGITVPVLMTALAGLSFNIAQWHTLDKLSDRFGNLFGWGKVEDHFDFIIVGGGTAGGVVAVRLAEHFSVLVLEAGGEIYEYQEMPSMSLLMLAHSEVDWNHKTLPQDNCCLALPNRSSHWSSGKGLGGTSNLNFLIHSRGAPKDFDNWARILNDSSWSYEGLLPHFKRTENYLGKWQDNGYHSQSGDLPLELPDYTGRGDLFVQAAEEMGYPNVDLNGNYTTGFDLIYYPVKDGRRFSTNDIINLYRSNKNLEIRKFSNVHKLLIDKEKRAYGVEYERHGQMHLAYCNKEVILAAGAINTPKLLLLSGVGPKEHLKSVNVSLTHDLPGVGRNLQDHVGTYLGPFFVDEPVTFSIERDVLNSQSLAEFVLRGKGVLSTSGTNAMGFLSTKYAKDSGLGDWPDVQTIMLGVSVGPNWAIDLARGFGVNKSLLVGYYEHAVGKESFTQLISLARPLARGYVELKDNNPDSEPLIDPKYYTYQRDMDTMVEAAKLAVSLVENTTTFGKIGGRFTDQVFPGCENVPFRSDAYWECYLRQYTITLHHIVGSCPMGVKENPYAVVDSELKVYGIEFLRIMDASVMPVVPIGNTNAPAIVIGEKGADLIIKYWLPW